MNSSASKVSENNEVQWYGKPEKKVAPKTGDPIICFIVGGTCYAEVGKCSKKGVGWDDGQIENLNELADTIGRNITIGRRSEEWIMGLASTNIFKKSEYVDSLRDMDLSVML